VTLRLVFALVWLSSANLQNALHALPPEGMRVAICGSNETVALPGVPVKPREGRDCTSACHSSCRRQGIIGSVDGD